MKYGELREQEAGTSRIISLTATRNPSSWQKGHPAHTQLQAVAALRSVHAVMGRHGRKIIGWLVIDNVTIKGIADRLAINPQEAKGAVVAVLIRMAEHWGFEAPARSRMHDSGDAAT